MSLVPRIADSILELIGRTPLVRLHKVVGDADATVLAKLEFLNPAGSLKDRIALAMVEAAEGEGKIVPGRTVIVEPTSGNTGIALAMVAAAKGYRLIVTMPTGMSTERLLVLRGLGTEVVLTPADEGMPGAIRRAEQIASETPDAFMPQQFSNPANPAIHAETTGQEILNDTGGKLDFFVAGVGTGGTLTGVARAIRPKLPDVKFVAVEPASSSVLSGGHPGMHKIEGIGAGFVPDVLDMELVDDVVTVSNDDAMSMARRLLREEGIFSDVCGGACVHAAVRLAERSANRGCTIVTIIGSTAERYVSTELFSGLVDEGRA
jgi:cysteine synthase A